MKPYLSVVVKPTLFCNTDCRHCYHTPQERVSEQISLETLDNLMRMVSEDYEAVWFIWHGGEPLTLKMDFFKKVIELEDKYFGKNHERAGNTVQTNGLNINRRFMAFCRQNMINVGVSYEGPYNHVLRQGDVQKVLDVLSDKENKYSVSCTICNETASKQLELYHYFRERGTNISFSPVIPAGCAKCNGTVPDADEYIRNSIETFDEWLYDKDTTIPLIPHYLYVVNYLGEPTPSDCAHTSCLTKWICINPNGDIYPCAKACPKEFRMGNVNEIDSISEAFRSEGFRKILLGSVKRREKCSSCEINDYCNGGCSMDAYHEGCLEDNGNDSCRIYKAIFTHVSGEIRRILDEKPDLSQYNMFVRDAILGKLTNPKTISQ